MSDVEQIEARLAAMEADANEALAHQRAIQEIKPNWDVVYVWAMLLNKPGGGGSHNFQPGVLSPAAVLALVGGIRAVVALHHEYDGLCTHCVDPFGRNQREAWPCQTITAIAAIWETP